MKECIGQTAFAQIKYIHRSKKYFISIDEEKKKECLNCELFPQCSWETNLRLHKQMLEFINDLLHSRPEGRGTAI